jgi:hypothetical protein
MFSTKAKAKDNTSYVNHVEIDALDAVIRDAELKKRELLDGPRELPVFDPGVLNRMPNGFTPNVITRGLDVFDTFAGLNGDGNDIGDDEDEDRLKIMVIGHGRHGKDTVSEILEEEYGYKFISSSLFCADKVMYPISKNSKTSITRPRFTLPWYSSVETCYADRHRHLSTWYEAIKAYNEFDPTRLGTDLYSEYDVYCGLRNKTEFHAMRNAGLFDVAIWVDRSDHVEPEEESSCTVEQWMADFTIDNNGDLGDLNRNVRSLMDNIHEG